MPGGQYHPLYAGIVRIVGNVVSIGSGDRLTSKPKPAANHLQTGPSEMHPKIACDHDDHDYYTDDVKNIHCFAPIENKRVSSASC